MDSIFECGVCFKTYNHHDKKPHALPCGHTFCLECLKQISKHNMIKCPFDKSQHQVAVDSLPANYAILTALPMHQPSSNGSGSKDTSMVTCDIHKSKKVKFFCKNDGEMFCSKCVLKHTNQKHEVVPCSYKSIFIFKFTYLLNYLFFLVIEMKRMVKEMLDEVDTIEKSNNVCEELYGKLEQKVRKKYLEETDKLDKSFTRIID